jgi:hypothetical protein
MATSGNTGNVPGEVEEVTLFFELSTLLIYHTSILHHNTLITHTKSISSPPRRETARQRLKSPHREIKKNVRL